MAALSDVVASGPVDQGDDPCQHQRYQQCSQAEAENRQSQGRRIGWPERLLLRCGLLWFCTGLTRCLGLLGFPIAGQPEALQVAVLEGLPSFPGGAVVVVVVHLVVADSGKGCTGLVEVARLQQPFLLYEVREASSKPISGQFPILALWMLIQQAQVGMDELVGDDGECSKVAVACRHLIAQRGFQVNGVIAWAVSRCIDS